MHKEVKVPKVQQVLKAIRVHKEIQGVKVLKELRVIRVHKVEKEP